MTAAEKAMELSPPFQAEAKPVLPIKELAVLK